MEYVYYVVFVAQGRRGGVPVGVTIGAGDVTLNSLLTTLEQVLYVRDLLEETQQVEKVVILSYTLLRVQNKGEGREGKDV